MQCARRIVVRRHHIGRYAVSAAAADDGADGALRALADGRAAGAAAEETAPELPISVADDAAEVVFARLASLAAVAANVACARAAFMAGLGCGFSSSAERKRGERKSKVRSNVSLCTCERAGAASVTCKKRPEAA